MIEDPSFIIDDRVRGDGYANNGKPWRAVTDTVMGGISKADLRAMTVSGKPCLHLRGEVHLENNGGFVQASLDLGAEGLLDASDYVGLEIEVCGNNESYNVHLRTGDTQMVWQSYRHSFIATALRPTRTGKHSASPSPISCHTGFSLDWIRDTCAGSALSRSAERWKQISASVGSRCTVRD